MSFGRGRPRRGKPNAVPGTYRYVNKRTGKVDYVGQSDNLRRRYQQHLRGDQPAFDPHTHHFDWQAQISGGTEERLQKEKDQYLDHKPPMNRRKGGGGRKPGAGLLEQIGRALDRTRRR